MNCSEARQYLFAFLDNELDSALSLEVQRHIEMCPMCARECEIENEVRRHLEVRLRNDASVPAFDEGILSAVRQSSPLPIGGASRPTPRARRFLTARFAATGAMAAVLALSVIWFATNGRDPSPGGTFADALVDDFDHFVTESKPLGIVSSDANAVSQWLRERTALAIRLPDIEGTVVALQGGRKCKIKGRPAAFAVYRVGNELASVVAIQESDEALRPMQRVERDGHSHWIDHCRGHTVLACRRGKLIYAIVSRLPEESLSLLMPPLDG